MLGKRYTTNRSYVEKTSLNDMTGEVNKTSTTTESTHFKSDKEMFNDYLGVGRYFIIFCLILFFIAPVFSDLNNNYRWEVTENGNTYKFVNPKDDIESYKNLGNKMMQGFTETLETIGNISDVSSKVVETVGKPLSWFDKAYQIVISSYNSVLEWFNGLF